MSKTIIIGDRDDILQVTRPDSQDFEESPYGVFRLYEDNKRRGGMIPSWADIVLLRDFLNKNFNLPPDGE